MSQSNNTNTTGCTGCTGRYVFKNEADAKHIADQLADYSWVQGDDYIHEGTVITLNNPKVIIDLKHIFSLL